VRITKQPEERKNEILETAGQLFITKGYNSVAISDIADEIGIAKGTIFHYFKSKEELLDAAFLKIFEKLVNNAQAIADDTSLSAIEKMTKLTDMDNLIGGDVKLKEFFETAPPPGNHDMTLKRLVLFISSMSPVMSQIIKQGISEKIMYTKYPDEVAEIIIAAEKTLFLGLFERDPEALLKKMIAYLHVVELALNIEEGTFAPIAEKFVELERTLGI
jgi:AcrR family transcriptional regulator